MQYNPIDRAIILIAATGVPMVKNVFTFIEDQKLLGYVLSLISVLFVLKIDMFHFLIIWKSSIPDYQAFNPLTGLIP